MTNGKKPKIKITETFSDSEPEIATPRVEISYSPCNMLAPPSANPESPCRLESPPLCDSSDTDELDKDLDLPPPPEVKSPRISSPKRLWKNSYLEIPQVQPSLARYVYETNRIQISQEKPKVALKMQVEFSCDPKY